MRWIIAFELTFIIHPVRQLQIFRISFLLHRAGLRRNS